jgi:hypothetical protein
MSNNETDIFVWPAEFTCTIIDDKQILSNHYCLTFYIEPITPVSEKFGIGFQKLKRLLYDLLDNSVIINQKNPLITELEKCDNNLVYMPSEPYDFYVGAVLFAKFIAITENYLNLYQFSIDSAVGDRLQYTLKDPYDSGLELAGDHWWNKDTLNTGTKDVITWDELNLAQSPKFKPTVIQGGKSEH